MNGRLRMALFWIGAIALAASLLWAMGGLPKFGDYRGPYGTLLNVQAIDRRHVTNVVTAVNFDYRALDTLGEEFIFFASIVGLTLLLRQMRGEPKEPTEEEPATAPWPMTPRAESLRWLGLGMAGVTVVFGVYIVIHAQLTPGGGFQGGAILGTGALLVYLTDAYRVFIRVSPQLMLEAAESTGAGGYVLIGLIPLAAGGLFLENFLPLGKTGQLVSSGIIALINLAVGLEISGGFVLLFQEFIGQIQKPQEPTR